MNLAARFLSLLSVFAALPVALPAPFATLAAFAAFGWTPGEFLARVLLRMPRASERTLLALTLSPFLAGGAAALLIAAGVPVAGAARAVAIACAALGIAGAIGRDDFEPVPEPRALWLPVLLWTALVAAFLRFNPMLAPRSDGWFHSAVTLQIASRGLPPENPEFAGLPLLYFWGSHLWAALWLEVAPRLAVWTPLVVFNVSAAAAVLLGVDGLARRLGADTRTRVLAMTLAVFGYAPFAWSSVPVRAMTGDVVGWPEVQRLIGEGGTLALQSLGAGTLHVSLVFFGDKYFCLTPFSMGLALFAAAFGALLDVIESRAVRPVLRAALLSAAALFVHGVAGLSLDLVALPIGAWLLVRALRGERGARGALIALAIALALGLAISGPYLFSVSQSKQHAAGLGASGRALLSLLYPGALYLLFGVPWLWRRSRERFGPAIALALAAALLGVLGVWVRLSESNQSKFFNLQFLLLAPAAALGISGFAERAGRARAAMYAALALATVPTTVFVLAGLASERGQAEERFHAPSPAVREAWSWLRANSDPRAVVVDRLAGSDMQVFAERSSLWSGALRERDWGHPDSLLESRRRASRALGSGRNPDPASREMLRSLARPLVVAVRTPGGVDSLGALARIAANRAYRPLHANRELHLFDYRVSP